MTEKGSFNQLLRRLADELAACADVADDCQGAIAGVIPASASATTSQHIQNLDLLSQSLRELGELIQRCAASRPCDEALPRNLFDGVRLSALRGRLTGRPPPGEAAPEPEVW
jgi:hypothetical protein